MKNKIYFIAVFLILFNDTSFSQSGWIQQYSGVNVKLNKVFFVNSQTGWIAGDSGKILGTTNGGNIWILRNSNTDHTLRSIYFLNNLTGYAAGGNYNLFTFSFHKILKTTNGGNSWLLVYDSADLENSLTDVYFINENTGFVIGSGGNESGSTGLILKTTNGGNNWELSSSYLAYRTIQFNNESTGYISANYSSDVSRDSIHILKTTDGGNNWRKVFSKQHAHLSSAYFINENTGWAAGYSTESGNNDFIIKTINSGINWQIFDFPSLSNINSIFFTSYDTGWYCNNGVNISTNSGANWINQVPNNSNDYYTSIYFVNNITGWTVGTNGKILKTISGGITSVHTPSENIPKEFFLYQNYPNPFNPTTSFKFDIPKSGLVKLRVYDINGKMVQELVNGNLNAGVYSYSFFASDLSSGMYFYTLETNGFTDTKKLMLIK